MSTLAPSNLYVMKVRLKVQVKVRSVIVEARKEGVQQQRRERRRAEIGGGRGGGRER